MKNVTAVLLLAAGVFIFSSCASVAHIEKDPSVNMNRYSSYAWLDSKDNDDRYLKGMTEKNLRNAVNNALSDINWKEDNRRPDVILKYDILIDKRLKEDSDPVYSRPFIRRYYNPYTRRWGAIYYPSEFMGFDRRQYEVREGTLTLTMIDSRTDKVIWQGWTTDEVRVGNLTKKEIEASVKSIFRKFDARG